MSADRKLTPVEIDRRIVASRQLLSACQAMPARESLESMRAEVGALEALRRQAPKEKAEKIARLMERYMAVISDKQEWRD